MVAHADTTLQTSALYPNCDLLKRKLSGQFFSGMLDLYSLVQDRVLVKIPNIDAATVSQEKITDYLLDLEHESGRGKALFFIHFGFSIEQWQQLARMLIDHVYQHEVVKQEITPFGTRYVVEGRLQTPSQRRPNVRSVWFIPNAMQNPQFVTAYPLEELDND